MVGDPMAEAMSAHATEIAQGERFEFGKNWEKFLEVLDEDRIAEAERSLREFLQLRDLRGLTFLDVGSGSGLFSLAARRLGAHVRSFDYDPQSVACTTELRRRFQFDDPNWVVEEGSVLDPAFLKSLGQFDIVYSWGVLHHTGRMWDALSNVATLVAPRGKLYIAIYNDQGLASARWARVKQLYCALPPALRLVVLGPAFMRLWGPTIVRDLARGRPLRSWRSYASSRGMSAWRDVVDWVGGYPFEVAKPEEIFAFYQKQGFSLDNMRTALGHGCNEFVFERQDGDGR